MMPTLRSRHLIPAMLALAALPRAFAGELEGTVLGPDGKPVANAFVAAVPHETQRTADGQILRHLTHSDAQGHFLLQGLPPDSYGATATSPDLGPAFVGNLKIPETGRLGGQVLRLGGPSVTVEGSLKTTGPFPDGAIVGAARISNDDGDVFYAEAKDGRYRFSLSPGKYLIAAKAQDWGSSNTPQTIAAADKTHSLDFRLVRENGSLPKLSKEIIDMEAADQKARFDSIKSNNDAVHQEATAVIDAKNEARVKEILKEHGWPNADMIGYRGVNALWLLVQHESPPMLKQCLPDMKAAVGRGELEWSTVALSIDRDLMYDGKKQIYGSQVNSTEGGKIELYPVEDEANLDERRAKIGLGPIAEYKAQIARLYAPGGAN